MSALKSAALLCAATLLAGCQTAARVDPGPYPAPQPFPQRYTPGGPPVGETRVVGSRVGDLAVRLQRADRGLRRFSVARLDGQPSRDRPGAEAVSIRAVQDAFPRGGCRPDRRPTIAATEFRDRGDFWLIAVQCR